MLPLVRYFKIKMYILVFEHKFVLMKINLLFMYRFIHHTGATCTELCYRKFLIVSNFYLHGNIFISKKL